MNGQINGFHNSLIDEDCFLFTSESVGEGHPGTYPNSYLKSVFMFARSIKTVNALTRRHYS